MAEAMFRKATENRFQVKSAGIAASAGGKSMNPHAVKFLANRGIELDPTFTSQCVSNKLLDEATHVFAMTESILRELKQNFPSATNKCFLVHRIDVPNPFRRGQQAYEQTGRVLDDAIPALIEFIDQKTTLLPAVDDLV
jgi:protein-tyrosine-phosphatase